MQCLAKKKVFWLQNGRLFPTLTYCCSFQLLQLLVCLKCLEQVLLFTASAATPTPDLTPVHSKHYSALGRRLVQRLLASHLKCLYHSLRSTAPVRLVGACLRLLTAMVIQGADSAKEVQLVFNLSYKPLQTFFSKATPISDTISVGKLK